MAREPDQSDGPIILVIFLVLIVALLRWVAGQADKSQ